MPTLLLLSGLAALAQSQPPTSAPGWYPVKPDGTLGTDPLNTDQIFYVYDWTNLDETKTVVLIYGPQGQPTKSKFDPGTSAG